MIRNKSKWSKGEMARTIVLYCIRVMTAVLVWAILITTLAALLHWSIDISPVLNFAAVTFGGELLLLALKRIIAKKGEEVC